MTPAAAASPPRAGAAPGLGAGSRVRSGSGVRSGRCLRGPCRRLGAGLLSFPLRRSATTPPAALTIPLPTLPRASPAVRLVALPRLALRKFGRRRGGGNGDGSVDQSDILFGEVRPVRDVSERACLGCGMRSPLVRGPALPACPAAAPSSAATVASPLPAPTAIRAAMPVLSRRRTRTRRGQLPASAGDRCDLFAPPLQLLAMLAGSAAEDLEQVERLGEKWPGQKGWN